VGFSAVTTGDLELARGALRELNVPASLTTLEEAMAGLEDHREGPVLLVEPSDDVCAGAAGDATRVLRAMVEHGVPDAVVVINDPETVAVLGDAKPGEHRAVEIGGKSGDVGSEPLPLVVELVSASDGRFEVEGHGKRLAGMSGAEIYMGPCAVVRHGGVTILLTSRRTPPSDLGQWRSQGVDPEGFFAVGVKAATEHRDAYEPIAAAGYVLDLPGPCAANLGRLPFRSVRRPIYPLDGL
jgi:microcystin degradation protein MlrC